MAALKDTPVRAAAAGSSSTAPCSPRRAACSPSGTTAAASSATATKTNRLEPTAVAALAGEKAAEVAAGESHTVVRLAGGELRAIGSNEYGQLGVGEAEFCPLPVEVDLALPAAAPAP